MCGRPGAEAHSNPYHCTQRLWSESLMLRFDCRPRWDYSFGFNEQFPFPIVSWVRDRFVSESPPKRFREIRLIRIFVGEIFLYPFPYSSPTDWYVFLELQACWVIPRKSFEARSFIWWNNLATSPEFLLTTRTSAMTYLLLSWGRRIRNSDVPHDMLNLCQRGCLFPPGSQPEMGSTCRRCVDM